MKMVRLCMILVLLLIMDATGTIRHSVEILVPPNHGSISSDELYIVGKTTAPFVDIFLNETRLKRLQVEDSIFHMRLNFGYGLNEVVVIPVDANGEAIQESADTAEVMFAPEFIKKYRKIYGMYNFHGSETTQECVRCHNKALENTEQMSDSASCLECHPEVKEGFKRHTPYDDKVCISCHALGDSLTGVARPNNLGTDPCFECHKDKINVFDKDHIHGPVAGGDCVICHDPHGSSYEHSLKSPEQILCFSCHSFTEKQLSQKVVHEPFRRGRCSECHDPHAANNKWVLVKSTESLCLGCHNLEENQKWHEHPYDVKPRNKVAAHLKLTEKGRLECLSCHNPHASRSEHLLKIGDEFTCLGCHEEKL